MRISPSVTPAASVASAAWASAMVRSSGNLNLNGRPRRGGNPLYANFHRANIARQGQLDTAAREVFSLAIE
jgi:hypothetical protein